VIKHYKTWLVVGLIILLLAVYTSALSTSNLGNVVVTGQLNQTNTSLINFISGNTNFTRNVSVGDTVFLSDGTLANPSLAFDSQKNTGWFFTGSRIDLVAVGATQVSYGVSGESALFAGRIRPTTIRLGSVGSPTNVQYKGQAGVGDANGIYITAGGDLGIVVNGTGDGVQAGAEIIRFRNQSSNANLKVDISKSHLVFGTDFLSEDVGLKRSGVGNINVTDGFTGNGNLTVDCVIFKSGGEICSGS